MKIETFEQRILIPEKGKWLYNATDNIISDKVYLGKEADASLWVEITDAKKQKIEAATAEEQTEV